MWSRERVRLLIWFQHALLLMMSGHILTQNKWYTGHISSNREPMVHLWCMFYSWDAFCKGESWEIQGIKGMPIWLLFHMIFKLPPFITALEIYLLMSNNNITVNNDSVCLLTIVNDCFLTDILYSKIMHQFACNPLMALDDKLNCDLMYVWSLPPILLLRIRQCSSKQLLTRQ